MFSPAAQAVLDEFQVHVDSCPGCQSGPLGMCDVGFRLSKRFSEEEPSATHYTREQRSALAAVQALRDSLGRREE